ncbi:conserved hypothetical protein [uncultured Alphaproteobacteria bacterium]|uniref:DUF1177 domain-containing protein n=1 Tax=uncultured Alphaproteobacteria bacterium TaxID=91750 RepID=A0A212JI79_9PROT|nr:conserved hypothetical protein [uncultured Alphaproteobacteria bacterium]
MILKQVLDIFDLLDRASANAAAVAAYLAAEGDCTVETRRATGAKGGTDLIEITIAGHSGRAAGGSAPTLGVIGRLGGIGARPDVTGFVSDGDGALTALAVAAKLARMKRLGDALSGDVVVTTHICPDAPTREHHPVPFMDSPLTQDEANAAEVLPTLDAILSIDTTRGNRVINHGGFTISPTVKEGYILRTSEDLLDLMTRVTGRAPCVFPLTQQDITPYGNGLYHLNSILQPATATAAPVVGVALTTEAAVAGCASGATQFADVEAAARFAVEVAKAFTAGQCAFYDAGEFALIERLYGSMRHFQTSGTRA